MAVILAIDDDKSTLKLLESQLKNTGHQVITASSGTSGIDMAKTGNPDLILLDILMPGLSGYEVLKSIKKYELTKSTPVIMLTSKSNREDVISAIRQGASDYIIKPHNLDNLKKKIDSALRVSKLHQMEEVEERTEHINIKRGGGTTFILFRTSLKNKQVISEAKTVFNPVFFKLARNDIIVFDLRSLPDMDEDDITFLKGIIDLFGEKEINVVAGRHYGNIVANVDFEERVRLHLSLGDLEVYLSEIS